jgi:hypothetical protein
VSVLLRKKLFADLLLFRMHSCRPFTFFLIPLKYEYVITLAAIALYPASHLCIHVLQGRSQSLLLNELVSIIYRHRPHLLRHKQERLKPKVDGVPSTVDGFVNSFHKIHPHASTADRRKIKWPMHLQALRSILNTWLLGSWTGVLTQSDLKTNLKCSGCIYLLTQFFSFTTSASIQIRNELKNCLCPIYVEYVL